MKKDFLECGKIVGTHGVRGMLRAELWCDSVEFLTQFKTVYLKENGEDPVKLVSVKAHGNVSLIKLENTDTLEQAEKLRGRIFYIKRDEVSLNPGSYFISELIDCEVNDYATGEYLGKITDVFSTGSNDVWTLENGGKLYYVPVIDGVIVSADVESGKAVIKPLEGTFDEN